MSDNGKSVLFGKAEMLSSTLGKISETSASAGQVNYSAIADNYMQTISGLLPHFERWAPDHQTVTSMWVTMDTVNQLYDAGNLRGALQQAYTVLMALPGVPDFPPIKVPPVPGSDD